MPASVMPASVVSASGAHWDILPIGLSSAVIWNLLPLPFLLSGGMSRRSQSPSDTCGQRKTLFTRPKAPRVSLFLHFFLIATPKSGNLNVEFHNCSEYTTFVRQWAEMRKINRHADGGGIICVSGSRFERTGLVNYELEQAGWMTSLPALNATPRCCSRSAWADSLKGRSRAESPG